MNGLAIEFAGEWFRPCDEDATFEIGREGDLAIDDNPHLHRRFLRITHEDGIWWLSKVGSLMSATVCSPGSRRGQVACSCQVRRDGLVYQFLAVREETVSLVV
jgi:hypothetical protein